MKTTKIVILALIISILSLSASDVVFADNNISGVFDNNTISSSPLTSSNSPATFYGTINDYADSYDVHVGDTFTITVSADNSGLGDWENVLLYAPIPTGLQYISHVMPDITSQDYDPSTGIWNIQQMKWTGRGHHKYMIITVKALPEAEGKTLSFSSRFTSLIFVEAYGNHTRTDMVANGWAPPGNTINIKVLPSDTYPIPPPPPVPPGPGLGPGDGPGNGNSNLKNNIMTALGKSQLQTGGGGGNGKAYEVTKASKAQNASSMYLLALLLIVAMILAGYFYGIRKER